MNLEDIFDQIQEDVLEDVKKDLEEDLKEAFKSSEAQASAKQINQLFAKHEQDPVADPSEIANQIKQDADGVTIKLNENQRRFVAADPIYGKDSIGLKYTDD